MSVQQDILNLNELTKDNIVVIGIEENASNDFKNRLIHSFSWDLTDQTIDINNLPYIYVNYQGQEALETIYNTNYYKSLDGVKYTSIIFPKGSIGCFTYSYTSVQRDVLDLETLTKDNKVVIGIDGNASNGFKNRLIHSFSWDLTGQDINVTNLPYIYVSCQGQETLEKIYNKNYYKSLDGVKYISIIFPKGSVGYFSYNYTIQDNAYNEFLKDNTVSVTIKSYKGLKEINLSSDFLDVLSIRFESSQNDGYFYLTGERVDMAKGEIKVYYRPDIYYQNKLVLGTGVTAYVYGVIPKQQN